MNTVTLNPGKPAVTKVVEVTPATPATVTLTISVELAGKLGALLGQCADSGIFWDLAEMADRGQIPQYTLNRADSDSAIAFFDEKSRNYNFKKVA